MIQSLMRDGGLVILCGVALVIVFMPMYLWIAPHSRAEKRKRYPTAPGEDRSRLQECGSTLLLVAVRGLQGAVFVLMMGDCSWRS